MNSFSCTIFLYHLPRHPGRFSSCSRPIAISSSGRPLLCAAPLPSRVHSLPSGNFSPTFSKRLIPVATVGGSGSPAGSRSGEKRSQDRASPITLEQGTEVNLEGQRWFSSALYDLRRNLVGPKGRIEGPTEPWVVSTMSDLLNLEKQYSFYGAYHSNKVNILIHVFFVWPIFYTSLILWAYTAPLVPLPLAGGTLPLQQYMILNWSFILAAIYALYYVALDKKAGSLGAALCLGCWIGANAVAQAVPWSVGWKIVLASQMVCWSAQIFGHQKFEGRAPALLDNLPQAFLMAPFFVLLEFLQSFFGYEPYSGFHRSVQKEVDDSIRKFRAAQGKRAA